MQGGMVWCGVPGLVWCVYDGGGWKWEVGVVGVEEVIGKYRTG